MMKIEKAEKLNRKFVALKVQEKNYKEEKYIMSKREHIQEEIQLAGDECCIVFDFACYFPYINPEILTFDFSLGMEEFDDYKLNHRYPNHSYQTISKKYGRKISRLGYPYVMKLNEQGTMLLSVKVGLKGEYITMIFPIKTNMTKDKPVCGLSFRYNFDKSDFHFLSHEKCEDGGWYPYYWHNHEIEDSRKSGIDVTLNAPHIVDENSRVLIYDDIIEPCPSALLDLLVL